MTGKACEKRNDTRKNILVVQNPKQPTERICKYREPQRYILIEPIFARLMSRLLAGPRQSMEVENLARSVKERGR